MNPKTFCAAPWFGIRLDWDGQFRPCCQLDKNQSKFAGRKTYTIHDSTVDEWMGSDYSTYLRKELTQGNCLPECHKCWNKEDNTLKNLRHISNDSVTANSADNIEKTWVKSFVNRAPNYNKYRLMIADIKLSNVCNFACAMCSPTDSSKLFDRWGKDQESTIVKKILKNDPYYFKNIVKNYQSQRGYRHLRDILTNPITHLKLLGGEPLLDNDLFEILQSQPVEKQSKINLHFITNGSQSLVDAVQKLSGYKNVSFGVSLEGVGEVQDYIRSGSNWAVVSNNILSAHLSGITVNIAHILQAMSIFGLPNLLNWVSQHNIPIMVGLLYQPEYLSLSVLPANIKNRALNKIQNMDNISLINGDIYGDTLTVDKIISIIDNHPIMSDNHYQEFLDYITWYEQKSPLKLHQIQPELFTG
jgi:sulfatase maturation enzyme AslB (radical SAM superfamily)